MMRRSPHGDPPVIPGEYMWGRNGCEVGRVHPKITSPKWKPSKPLNTVIIIYRASHGSLARGFEKVVLSVRCQITGTNTKTVPPTQRQLRSDCSLSCLLRCAAVDRWPIMGVGVLRVGVYYQHPRYHLRHHHWHIRLQRRARALLSSKPSAYRIEASWTRLANN